METEIYETVIYIDKYRMSHLLRGNKATISQSYSGFGLDIEPGDEIWAFPEDRGIGVLCEVVKVKIRKWRKKDHWVDMVIKPVL